MIRSIQPQDAPAITDIYNYYIRTSIITFEEEEITIDEMERRIQEITESFQMPFIVILEDDTVVGYAYIAKWRTRDAYRFSAESSIYLHHEHFGKGMGFSLYEEIIRLAKEGGWKRLIGGASLPNPASIRLHEKLGFKKVGHFEKVGFKFNEWIDVGFWQLDL
ncbi:GNAT family N-acetyltransferase [Crocinitomicaceae bacterium]|nr:GNAT family N-acetyltransferase [Crocinitomicaceae bacterium]